MGNLIDQPSPISSIAELGTLTILEPVAGEPVPWCVQEVCWPAGPWDPNLTESIECGPCQNSPIPVGNKVCDLTISPYEPYQCRVIGHVVVGGLRNVCKKKTSTIDNRVFSTFGYTGFVHKCSYSFALGAGVLHFLSFGVLFEQVKWCCKGGETGETEAQQVPDCYEFQTGCQYGQL
jgi:hypothetical protein